MGITKIEWAKRVWNPVTGCTPVSEGCQNCYAKRMAPRLGGRYGYPKTQPFSITFHPDRLNEPLHWKKPSRVFVCSMSDLFHEDVSEDNLQSIFDTMNQASHHLYLLLTKRPQRMAEVVPHLRWGDREWRDSPPQNVLLGVTTENQRRASERIPILLEIPAVKVFISVEPMLEPVKIKPEWLSDDPFIGLDWVICGGESGLKPRPMHPDWARSLRDQCHSVGVPFFFKQMAGKKPIPEDLMIRELPM
jgi:protein gp37